MKIAQVVSTYPPYRGGMGSVAHEYTERLRAHGHHVHVFTPRYHRLLEEDPKYIHRIPSPLHIGNAGVVPSLATRLKGFDVIHLHYPFFGGAEPVIIRKWIRYHQPLVVTYHMDVVGTGIKGRLFDLHRRLLFPWIMNRADRILVSSQTYADTSALQKLSPSIREKIAIHPFGVDVKRFFPGKEPEMRTRLGLQEDVPVILFLGTLDRPHYFKGLAVLIESLSALRHLSWQCLVVGDGDLRPFYERLTQEKNLWGRIHFMGQVSEEEKPQYFRAADMHVFPSIDRSEAFGLVALEAAASGLPTIASNLPGVNVVVQDPQTGMLITPDQPEELQKALMRLLQDRGLREAMGSAARERAEEFFSWEACLSPLEALYEELVSKKTV